MLQFQVRIGFLDQENIPANPLTDMDSRELHLQLHELRTRF